MSPKETVSSGLHTKGKENLDDLRDLYLLTFD